MSLISFLNYIVFEIQYIVSKKSSSFYDNKKDPLKTRLREDLVKACFCGYVKATLFYHTKRLSQLFTQLLNLCLELLDPSLLIFNSLE